MRFPKTILLYCVDAADASVITIVLRSKGFRVSRTTEPGSPKPDLALILDDKDLTAATYAHRHSKLFPELPMLIKGSGRPEVCRDYPGSAQKLADGCSVEHMIERMTDMIRKDVVQRHGDSLRAHAKARKVNAA